MTLEGQNVSGSIGGKVSLDAKASKYLSIKKLSLDNSGNAVFDADLPNLIKYSTFMVRYYSFGTG